ncbi:MAG: hypothetical protein M5U34_14420 [Chloroflexi bacterium]|nr:hypothetical protein [Chloroflexota bacterium]
MIDPDYTDPYRAIEPSITIKGNTILLAYNRIVSIGGKFNHQVYVTKSEIKCDNFVFLPAILKK